MSFSLALLASHSAPAQIPERDGVRGLLEPPTLRERGRLALEGAEIPAYDPRSNMLFVTAGGRVAMAHLGDGMNLRLVRWLDIAEHSGFPAGMGGAVTHVEIDPLGRSFGAATVAPDDHAGLPGVVVLFSTRTGAALSRVTVGYNPDSFAFAPDGSCLVVANEGEPSVGDGGVLTDPPGSISVVSLAGIETDLDCERVAQSRVSTVYFDSEALSDALHASASDPRRAFLRVHPRHRDTPSLDLEPEYIAIVGRTAYITLQENNAIASFDLATMRVESVSGLGLIDQRIDASSDHAPFAVTGVFASAPMPDQLAPFTADGQLYFVTANEGDARGLFGAPLLPLADQIPLGELSRGARGSDELRSMLQDEPGLAGLLVCAHSGDFTRDGVVDTPVAMGARSASVWRVLPGGGVELAGDTGDAMERTLAALAPDRYNSTGRDGAPGARSVVRGPEPEGVVVAEVDGARVGFVGFERPGAIATIDLRDPAAPRMIDLLVAADAGDLGPEGMRVIAPRESPTGAALLVAAFEESGTLVVYEIAIP